MSIKSIHDVTSTTAFTTKAPPLFLCTSLPQVNDQPDLNSHRHPACTTINKRPTWRAAESHQQQNKCCRFSVSLRLLPLFRRVSIWMARVSRAALGAGFRPGKHVAIRSVGRLLGCAVLNEIVGVSLCDDRGTCLFCNMHIVELYAHTE